MLVIYKCDELTYSHCDCDTKLINSRLKLGIVFEYYELLYASKGTHTLATSIQDSIFLLAIICMMHGK